MLTMYFLFDTTMLKMYFLFWQIKGSITAPKDLNFWKFSSDEKKVWIQFSGINDLIVNGKGDINGQGSSWWLRYPKGQESKRPTVSW